MIAAAAGIRRVVDSQMADLIRKSTLERGYDPRDFVMMAYGGAGPVHAASYAAEVGCERLVVPFFATVHSAYGAALSDIRFSLQFSEPIVLQDDPTRIEAIFGDGDPGAGALVPADVPGNGATITLGRGPLSPPGPPAPDSGAGVSTPPRCTGWPGRSSASTSGFSARARDWPMPASSSSTTASTRSAW